MVILGGFPLMKNAFFWVGKYNDPTFLQSARKETKIFLLQEIEDFVGVHVQI